MLKQIIYHRIFICAILVFSANSIAQVEVVNQQLINDYGLDFSDAQVDFSLEVGADEALYLRDHSNNSLELISKTRNGQPAVIENISNSNEASADFSKIAYVSKNPDIVSGDSGSNADVFVYDRSSDETIRVEGLRPHVGYIYGVRISPTGDHVAFDSSDTEFSETVGAHKNTYGGRLYIYDLNQKLLTNVRYEGGNYGSGLYLSGADDDSFSPDGTKFFFSVSWDSTDVGEYFYFNEIESNTTTRFGGFLALTTLPGVKVIDNSHFISYSSNYDNNWYNTEHLILTIYNADTGEKTSPFSTPHLWDHFAGTSANRRYALFYTSRYSRGYLFNYGGDKFADATAGIISVYDTLSGQSLPAFAVNRQAKNYLVNKESYGYFCTYDYVLLPAYLDQIAQEFPCTEIFPISDVDDYLNQSTDAYNLEPDDIRFHNNDRYITFDANAWYLDEGIAYDEFAIPYARDTFVVVNPFLETINLVGEPDIDGSTESGVFIWREADGRTLMQVVAGDPAQNGQITSFQGRITSGSGIGNLLPMGLESSDSLTQSELNRIDFDLLAQRPYNDRVSFVADITESLCVDLTDYAGGLYLGPDKVEVTPPYDVHGLVGCDKTPVELDGEPVIDGSTESGVFVWRNPFGRYVVEFIAGDAQQGGTPTEFSGSIESNDSLTMLTGINLEPPDVFALTTANKIDFDLLVQRPWYDSLAFSANENASVCVNLDEYAGGLYLGPNKVEVTPPYDIHGLQACDDPAIEVDGAPLINQSLDVGWFIWRDNGVWNNRFVTGGTTYRYQGSYSSSSTMTNLVPISIEGNDVLGRLPSTQLNFGLTVINPYLDGFNLQVDSTASTCVSLDAPAGVNIYLGPDRALMPRSFDLTTFGACLSDPGIATLGKPSINRTTDKGIFLWERASNDWSGEVVTGNTAESVIDIDVVSQQMLSNVAQVGIESNDVFTVLPQQLDLTLKVRAPWSDGFEFSAQSQSQTCVSTPSSSMPIYLGPNRVEVGSSVNLDTQASCQ